MPAAAVFKTPEGGRLRIAGWADRKAHQAKVKVGLRRKEMAEIQSGIKAGRPGDHTRADTQFRTTPTIVIEAAPAADSDIREE